MITLLSSTSEQGHFPERERLPGSPDQLGALRLSDFFTTWSSAAFLVTFG